MERKSFEPKYDGLIEEGKVRLIAARARRYKFKEDEIADLKQQIVPELLNVKFDPDIVSGAKESTFIIAVIDRQLKKIMRNRKRNKRRANYEASSLDNEEDIFNQSSYYSMQPMERVEHCIDLERAMVGLSAEEKEICKRLDEGYSQEDIAKEMGKSKAAMSNKVKKLREKFTRRGFEI